MIKFSKTWRARSAVIWGLARALKAKYSGQRIIILLEESYNTSVQSVLQIFVSTQTHVQLLGYLIPNILAYKLASE